MNRLLMPVLLSLSLALSACGKRKKPRHSTTGAEGVKRSYGSLAQRKSKRKRCAMNS